MPRMSLNECWFVWKGGKECGNTDGDRDSRRRTRIMEHKEGGYVRRRVDGLMMRRRRRWIRRRRKNDIRLISFTISGFNSSFNCVA